MGKIEKVLMLIRTTGLKYDDRLRKECNTLKELNYQPLVGVVESNNTTTTGKVYDDIPFKSFSLTSRKILPHSKGVFIKIIEMYIHFIFMLIRHKPKYVWVHNIELMGLLPFLIFTKKIGYIKYIIWDQHELPPAKILNNKFLFKLYSYLSNKCQKVIVANNERKDFLLNHNNQIVNSDNNLIVIENFPDSSFILRPTEKLPINVQNWLGSSRYFLGQGGGAPDRYLENIVAALFESKLDAKLIIVGSYNETEYEEMFKKYGQWFKDKIYFTNMIPQMDVLKYIDHSLCSIIFYKMNSLNNKYCAPNRMFQAICRGVPVIVGNNPPMAKKVNDLDCGISIQSDGNDMNQIMIAMIETYTNGQKYVENTKRSKSKYLWESQKKSIQNLFSN